MTDTDENKKPDGGSSTDGAPAEIGTGQEATEPYADFVSRVLAALIDGVIIAIPINILFGGPTEIATGMNALVMAGAFLAYKVYFETSERQATIGKMLMRIRVQTEQGGRLDYQQGVIRSTPYWLPSLLGFVSGLLAFAAGLIAIVSCVSVMYRERNQGLHDSAANSVVVKL